MRNIIKRIAAIIVILLSFQSCRDKPRVYDDPRQAIETYVNAMIDGDADAMISVAGTITGDPIDEATKAMVKSALDSIDNHELGNAGIKNFKVDIVEADNKVALCKITLVMTDGKTHNDEGSVVKGADGGWRIPLFE